MDAPAAAGALSMRRVKLEQQSQWQPARQTGADATGTTDFVCLTLDESGYPHNVLW